MILNRENITGDAALEIFRDMSKESILFLKFWDNDYPYLDRGENRSPSLLPVPADSEAHQSILTFNIEKRPLF